MLSNKQKALAEHLVNEHSYTTKEAIQAIYDNDVDENDIERITIGDREFTVYTNEVADEAWNESLDSYIDDCILPEKPECYQNYFDSDDWKEDAKMDGRGHSLSGYNGEEYEYCIDNEYLYIYEG